MVSDSWASRLAATEQAAYAEHIHTAGMKRTVEQHRGRQAGKELNIRAYIFKFEQGCKHVHLAGRTSRPGWWRCY
jgi:hypothetical protein